MAAILIGCEYSGAVRDEFAALGHDAWSNDILPSERGGQHMQCDVKEAVTSRRWDLILLHPECTKIALCGNKHYGRGKEKHQERLDAIDWTVDLWQLALRHAPKVALENPRNVLTRHLGFKPSVIHPWQFGHMEQKETWLWLHGLPPLVPASNVYEEMMQLPKCERERIFYMSPGSRRGLERARTYPGIAKAIATQWSKVL